MTIDSIVGKRLVDSPVVPFSDTTINTEIVKKIAKDNGLDAVRVWGPNSLGTADFVNERLNVHVNGSGVIEKVRVG